MLGHTLDVFCVGASVRAHVVCVGACAHARTRARTCARILSLSGTRGEGLSVFCADEGAGSSVACFEIVSDMLIESSGGIIPMPTPLDRGTYRATYVYTDNFTRTAEDGRTRHEWFPQLLTSSTEVNVTTACAGDFASCRNV